jgi:hypothetical protein
MESKYKVVLGSLVGAAAIHAAFLACGSTPRTVEVPGDGGLMDAVLDVIGDIVGSETHDAVAAGDAGGACGCTTSTPASENSAQMKSGSLTGLSPNTGQVVVSGPFVLTDATATSAQGFANAALVVEANAAACNPLTGPADGEPGYLTAVQTYGNAVVTIHGGRYFIPAGHTLCAYQLPASAAGSGLGQLQWAGFVPYQ